MLTGQWYQSLSGKYAYGLDLTWLGVTRRRAPNGGKPQRQDPQPSPEIPCGTGKRRMLYVSSISVCFSGRLDGYPLAQERLGEE